MSKFNAGKASVLVLTAVFAFVVGSMLLAGLGVFTQTVAAASPTIEEVSAQLNFNGAGGWGGWSCPEGYPFIVSASVTNSDGGAALYPITSLTLWKTGATVSGFTYPGTPFGYTYNTGEEGAIVQNNFTTEQSLKIHLICGLQAPTPTPTRSDFNLTSMCKPADNEGSLRIRNNSGEPQAYTLSLYGGSVIYTGTAAIGDSLTTVPWNTSSDTWILQIAGYSFTKAIGNNASCESPTPTPTPTSTTTTTSNDGGDGLGCATHDCSGNANKAPQGQVLGASTLADTGNFAEDLYLAIMTLGGTLSAFGIKNFKKTSR